MSHFSAATISFLKDLKKHNDRDWFKANQARYEANVREPARQLIRDFAPQLAKVSSNFLASDKKVGGSLFRIQNDLRFAKDKDPYKTHIGIQFRHARGKDAHTPGFYLHIEPGNCFFGAGIWRPDSKSAASIRKAIDGDQNEWKKIWKSKKMAGFEKHGESLKRPPRGFNVDHPLIEDLKRKDFLAFTKLSQKDVVSKNALKTLTKSTQASARYVEFLCVALGQTF